MLTPTSDEEQIVQRIAALDIGKAASGPGRCRMRCGALRVPRTSSVQVKRRARTRGVRRRAGHVVGCRGGRVGQGR